MPVLVPAPERYAVHKLIIATKRNVFFADKSKKEINQAGALIQAFNAVKRSSDLGFAWMEGWERGARWRRRLGVGALRLSDDTFKTLEGRRRSGQTRRQACRGVRAYGRQGRSSGARFNCESDGVANAVMPIRHVDEALSPIMGDGPRKP
ncbi:GSU2403 family nucleotidyltransferase fold protein [Bradyrhizobium sp. CB1015]|uniref:GSU2403 family nucleotidyltransferase fold protein n=1 Tax=Bradyrhizobium sp. CB1015 TaxID=2976822 RepID=UPI00390634F6